LKDYTIKTNDEAVSVIEEVGFLPLAYLLDQFHAVATEKAFNKLEKILGG
jgi:hypothetical protein